MENIVREICKYIIDNLYDDISLDKLESVFYYNRYYLIRVFKLYTGYTIKEFSNVVKVLKTIDPLIFTNDTILKIALNNGFNSQEYYSERFQNIIGVSPLKFRKRYREIDLIEDIDELKVRKDYLVYLEQYREQLLGMADETKKIGKVNKLTK